MKRITEYFRSHRLLASLCILLISIAFYMILENLSAVNNIFRKVATIINPLLWGAFLAYLLDPFVMFLERHVFSWIKKKNISRSVSIIVALVIALSLVVSVLILIIPQLISSVKLLAGNFDSYLESFKALIADLANKYPFLESVNLDTILVNWQEIISTLSQWAGNNLSSILGTSVRVGTGIFNFLLAVVFMIYMLFDKARLLRMFRKIFRSKCDDEKYERLHSISVKSNNIFKRYLVGNIIDAIIIGVLNLLFMTIFGMPYALLISFIMCITNLIPTFGPIIGAIPSLFILVLINPFYALWFLIWTIVTQLCDSSLIKPWLFGDSTGLSPLGVLAAIIISGRIFGIVGMFLAVPVAGIITYLLKEYFERKLKENGCDNDGNKLPAPKAAQPTNEGE